MLSLVEPENMADKAEIRVCECGRPIMSQVINGFNFRPRLCEACRDEEARRKEREETRRRTEALYAKSALPPAAREWTLDRAAKRAVPGFHQARYWQYSREGLYLYGPAGTG
ncbi:MAG: hypothetical protein HQK55_15090, partial [Deltaproteobacteria bacterium]|nr:hypothetical protein [Deltaproteobacteria bacterium]